MDQYTVFLVEDDANTCNRLANVVRAHPQLDVVATAASYAEARQLLERIVPDVLLCDLGLPDGDGTDLIRKVRQGGQQTEVMVITVFGDEKHVISAIEAGATGYLLKDGNPDYIGNSILQMLDGGSPISASIARHLLKRFKPVESDVPLLTAREKEVLQYLSKGFNATDIARMLNISSHTVNTHVKHIYRKLAVRSRGEAVYEAHQMGLINMDD